MSDDQVGCEWVSVSSGTGLPRLSRTKAVKRLCVCVCVHVCFGTFCDIAHVSDLVTLHFFILFLSLLSKLH